MAVFCGCVLRGPRCFVRIVFPDARDCGAALGTASMPEPVLGDVVPGAADQQCAAARATGVRAIAVDVAFVYVMEAGIFRDLSGAVQRLRGCCWFVAKLEIGMEGGEVQR